MVLLPRSGCHSLCRRGQEFDQCWGLAKADPFQWTTSLPKFSSVTTTESANHDPARPLQKHAPPRVPSPPPKATQWYGSTRSPSRVGKLGTLVRDGRAKPKRRAWEGHPLRRTLRSTFQDMDQERKAGPKPRPSPAGCCAARDSETLEPFALLRRGTHSGRNQRRAFTHVSHSEIHPKA